MDETDREQLKLLMDKHGIVGVSNAISEILSSGDFVVSSSAEPVELRCSFCGKRKSEVGDHIIAGPGVFICIECVRLCNQIKSAQWPDEA